MTTPTRYALAAARANTTAARDARAHLAAGMQCDHKWRYSNGRDVFYCQYCYLTESPDAPTTTPKATQ